jgi:hypothetical protein
VEVFEPASSRGGMTEYSSWFSLYGISTISIENAILLYGYSLSRKRVYVAVDSNGSLFLGVYFGFDPSRDSILTIHLSLRVGIATG